MYMCGYGTCYIDILKSVHVPGLNNLMSENTVKVLIKYAHEDLWAGIRYKEVNIVK